MTITVRELTNPEEFAKAEEVQKSAWGMSDIMVTPKEIMIAIQSNGGLVLGAFEYEKMVGMALTLVGYRVGKTFMYSHITGVSKEHQSQGIGFLLKQKQREISLNRGFDLIAWTFDPIIARNAYFNLSKLGVICRNYKVNYYGSMDDAINFGWETDRVIAEWLLKENLEELRLRVLKGSDSAHLAIKTGDMNGWPICLDWNIDLGADTVLVEIPRDIVNMKKVNAEEANRWRMATREIFQAYFGSGFAAIDLVKRNDRIFYVIKKAGLPPNIFLH
jgi:predicted GNAT superfamily acetyltransferase